MKFLFKTSVAIWGSVILTVVVAALFAVFQFIDSERERDLQGWQVRMGIVADSRKDAVERWLDQQFSHLRGLAQNSSLQFYAMDLIGGAGASTGNAVSAKEAAAEARYLQNLLTVTAERTGFDAPLLGPEVNANVTRVGVAGLALLNIKGKVLVATSRMPPITGELAQSINAAPKAKQGLIDVHVGNSGNPTVGFTVPVFAVQGNAVASDQVGILVGLKEVSKELYPLLKQPGSLSETGEAVLVRQAGPVIEYISPLQNETPPLKLKMAADTPKLAARFALNTPGGFGVQRDYRNREVLVVSRQVVAAPWTLMYKIDRDEALADSDARLQAIIIVLILVVVVVMVTIIAVWRYGASIRANQAMEMFQRSSVRFENMAKFMRLLSDNLPAQVFVVSEEGEYTFANRTAAEKAGTHVEDMIGKDLISVVGPIKAAAFKLVNDKVLEDRKPASQVYKFEESDGTHMYRASHSPMQGDAEFPPGVLVVLNDVSDMITIQERRDNAMRQLTRTLVTLIDRKDRFSAVHATLVAKLGVAIAGALELPDDEKRTVELAGNLINLGKAFVPAEVLLKKGALTETERDLIEEGMTFAVNLIEGIEFIGPVAQTLGQVRERWDGSGRPKGLKGEDISIEARVVMVANAFVGLRSPRSHRKAKSYEDAIEILHEEIGSKFDRRVVAAVSHLLENRDGKKLLDFISDPGAWETPDGLIKTITKLSGAS